jgi:hypothetical protein
MGLKPWEEPVVYTDVDAVIDDGGTEVDQQQPPQGDTSEFKKEQTQSSSGREAAKADPARRDPSVVDAPPRPIDEFGLDDDDFVDV